MSGDDNDEIVKFLIRQGIDPNSKDIYGENAIMMAASNGHRSVVTFLKKHVDELNFSNKNGFTFLMASSK